MDRRSPSYYKVSEVANMLGVTDQTIYRWIKKGLIACIKLPSGHLRISDSQLSKIFASYRLNRRRIRRRILSFYSI
ncbi:MAG: helix-turn-helix domain-containing protein [Candidatus Bathyarchaeia archaeon]